MSSGYPMNNVITQPKEDGSGVALGQFLTVGVFGFVSVLLFVITRSMLSGGEVTANSISQWLIGLLPLAAITIWSIALTENHVGLSRMATVGQNVDLSRAAFVRRNFDLLGTAIVGWNLALVVFISVHELHFANDFQTVFFSLLGYNHPALVEFVMSMIYAASGVVALQLGLSVLRSSRQRSLPSRQWHSHPALRWIEFFCLNSVLFVCFVYGFVV